MAQLRGCGSKNRDGQSLAIGIILLTMKIKFFPITLGPMRQLTLRGLALKEKLEKVGLRVFETYPGAVQDLWGIPR